MHGLTWRLCGQRAKTIAQPPRSPCSRYRQLRIKMSEIKTSTMHENAKHVGQILMELYWAPMFKYLSANENVLKTFTSFLLQPEQLTFYFGNSHMAIEYSGPICNGTLKNKGTVQMQVFDYTESEEDLIDMIVGFKYDGSTGIKLPLPTFTEDLIVPTNDAVDKMVELKWNFEAQNAMISLNSAGFELQKGQFHRLINSLFFDSTQDELITRHIKWIDFIPIEYDNSNPEYDTISFNLSPYSQLVEQDANYIYPLPNSNDFKYNKLPQLNRFIEISANKNNSEPEITSFLEKENNKFILSMAFLAKSVHSQLQCEWQSEDKKSIIPDFFILRHNGFADIVEFKLPYLKNKSTVGGSNRETFSAEINKYISQTRVYDEYFEDPNNRKWFKETHGFEVRHPKRILIMGRRWDFSTTDWKKIENDYKNIQIMSYDELIDGVMAQFYV